MSDRENGEDQLQAEDKGYNYYITTIAQLEERLTK